jgi:hypothetical protein
LQGKIVQGRKLHASKEKGKEEKETLTVSENDNSHGQKF